MRINWNTRPSNRLWTLGDQFLVSGSNFFLSILFVKYLGMESYGIFSLYWMLVLFGSGIQQSLITMPLYTLFTKHANPKSYLGATLKLQLLFSAVSACCSFFIIILIQFAYPEIHTLDAVLISLITGIYTLQDFLRRAFFVLGIPKKALRIDWIGFGVLPISLIVLNHVGLLGMTSVLIMIVFLKSISILMGWAIIRHQVNFELPLISVRRSHWIYGRFLFASSLLQWSAGNVFILFSALIIGPIAIGALRIAQNILGVLNIFFLYLENVIPIEGARIYHENGAQNFKEYMVTVSKKYAIYLITALVLIYVFQENILHLLYGSELDGYQWLIPAFCMLYVFIFLGTIIRFILRTIERNNVLFYGYAISSIVGLACVYPLLTICGLYGVMIGLFLTQIVSLTVYIYYLKFKL